MIFPTVNAQEKLLIEMVSGASQLTTYVVPICWRNVCLLFFATTLSGTLSHDFFYWESRTEFCTID
jgi:hypothetical protein